MVMLELQSQCFGIEEVFHLVPVVYHWYIVKTPELIVLLLAVLVDPICDLADVGVYVIFIHSFSCALQNFICLLIVWLVMPDVVYGLAQELVYLLIVNPFFILVIIEVFWIFMNSIFV